MSEQVHGTCGVCGSGITVEDGLIVGRDDADLLEVLDRIAHGKMTEGSDAWIARAAIAKAKV